MKKVLLNLIVFILMTVAVKAQVENIPLVTVTGEAAVKVVPDLVIIGIRIEKRIQTNLEGERTVFEIFRDEDTKIRLFNFDEKQISESFIQLDDSRYVKEVFITINDLSRLDKTLLELHKLGFRDYIYLDYRVKNLVNHKAIARSEAINAARRNAMLLVNSSEQSIGKIHLIEELDSEDYNWYNINNSENLEDVSYKMGADNYLITPGYITITSKMKVSFDLLK